MDAWKVFEIFMIAMGAIIFSLYIILPAAMHSAHIRPNEKRRIPLSVDTDTFVRRFDEKVAGQKPVFMSPYYVYEWKTVGKSFFISRRGERGFSILTLHATVEPNAIVYTLASAGISTGYSEKEEVRKIEALLASLAGNGRA